MELVRSTTPRSQLRRLRSKARDRDLRPLESARRNYHQPKLTRWQTAPRCNGLHYFSSFPLNTSARTQRKPYLSTSRIVAGRISRGWPRLETYFSTAIGPNLR